MVESKSKVKSFSIDKRVVWDAWKQVRANQGAAGVDEESVAQFERNLSGNLYKLWNRMSSGTYMPPPVKAVQIPKKGGRGVRTLGVPTVADRVAQTVVKLYLEPEVEPVFHQDSYGYRPGRSALDAVGVCRKRCWKMDWIIDLDYAAFFDSIDHELMLKAVAARTDHRWVMLYVERWLKAPLDEGNGTVVARDRGTPQGSAISPVLANIYLHYALDAWMVREFPAVPFERYADDVVLHCKSEPEARDVLGKIKSRMADCHLELNDDKTHIVCVSRGYVELAGESPVAVMTKQPCSWWATVGETRLSKPHDKVAFKGGEQACGPYDEESCASVVSVPARAGRSGSRASRRWAKATEGVKTLESQHRGIRRRIGIGTYAQFSTERERSVSAPAFTVSGCLPGALREVATPITGNTGKWWSAERKSEEA
jgi:group II intron reverse transcriptase/maturase